MAYTDLDAELYGKPEGLPQDQSVEIGLLSDFDYIDDLLEDDADVGLLSLEPGSKQTGIARKHGSVFARNAKLIILASFLFVAGVFTILFSQWLSYEKVADETNLFVLLSWYASQAMVGFLPSVDAEKDAKFQRNKKAKKRLLKFLKGMCSVDLICGALIMAGFFKIGASLFQIVSALGIPATALMARIIIKRRLNIIQWIGIIVIVVGFSSDTIFPFFLRHPTEAVHLSAKQALANHSILVGIILTVGGFLLASGLSVVTEKLILEPENPSPTMICTYSGIYSTLLCLLAQMLFVLPFRYGAAYSVLSNAFGTSGQETKDAWIYLAKLFGGFGLLTVIHVYQNYAYYILIEAWGVIPLGILSAARSVVIMLVSSKLFCTHDANQCFTSGKILSAAIVTAGVFLYNVSSLRNSTSK